MFTKLRKDKEDIKKTQIKFHKAKTSDIKTTLNMINRLEIIEEKISEIEDTKIETKMKHKEKNIF